MPGLFHSVKGQDRRKKSRIAEVGWSDPVFYDGLEGEGLTGRGYGGKTSTCLLRVSREKTNRGTGVGDLATPGSLA